MNKKIFIFYPYINSFGGIEKLICELGKYNKINLICYSDYINLSKYNNKIKIIKLNPKNYLDKILLLKKLFKNKLFKGLPLMWGYKAAFFAYLSNIKFYAVFIDDPISLLTKSKKIYSYNFLKKLRTYIANYIQHLSINYASKRITLTKRNSIELFKTFNCKFNYFYPGVSFKQSLKIKKSQQQINILSISRLEKNKKIDWILKSIYDLKKTDLNIYKKINLSIVGVGKDRARLEKICKNFFINEKVFFHGFVSEKKKIDLLKKSNIFLIPAKQGYGIPALEALKYNNKLIINKESRICEILTEGDLIKISKNNYKSFFKKFKITLLLKKSNKNFNYKLSNLPNSINWSKNISNFCGWNK